MYRSNNCAICGGVLIQPSLGRRRRLCPKPECRREAEALRKRLRRRRLAGVPPPPYSSTEHAAPLPNGGRDSVVRRRAKRLAADRFPHVQLDEKDLARLEQAVLAGVGRYTKVWGRGAIDLPPGLPVWSRAMEQRNHAGARSVSEKRVREYGARAQERQPQPETPAPIDLAVERRRRRR